VICIVFTFLICYLSIAAADILLWRDDKRTFSYITVLFLLLCWFLLSDRTFIASAAKILLVASLALFIHGVLPPQVYVLCLTLSFF
jgi:plant 3beta-hydroxysteroid-4alpha-carboxylate 3-dehydrogenase